LHYNISYSSGNMQCTAPFPHYYRDFHPHPRGKTAVLNPIPAVLPWRLSPSPRYFRGYRGITAIPIPVSLFTFYLSFSLAYSQPSHTGCLPYFHTWCGLSANLGCRSETCCTQLAENTGCEK